MTPLTPTLSPAAKFAPNAVPIAGRGGRSWLLTDDWDAYTVGWRTFASGRCRFATRILQFAPHPLSAELRPIATSNALTAGTSMASVVNPYAATTERETPKVPFMRYPVIA